MGYAAAHDMVRLLSPSRQRMTDQMGEVELSALVRAWGHSRLSAFDAMPEGLGPF
jgi:hypothetical protein